VTIESAGLVGSFSSLALDAQGNPVIAYCSNIAVRCATRNGGVWAAETVDTVNTSGGGGSTSLALDVAGGPA